MSLSQSPWPRRVTLAYVGLVFFSWVLALWPSSGSDAFQTLPILVSLPWSLILLGAGTLALPGLFLAGLLNASILYILLRGQRQRLVSNKLPLQLPPAVQHAPEAVMPERPRR